jgi:hypothetical protein
MIAVQDVVEQGRFARAQKAAENRHWHRFEIGSVHAENLSL